MIFHKIFLLILFLFILGCSASKINKSHGTVGIEDKYSLLKINENNSNDIVSLLGPPSTKSKFDKNLWIYIERKKTNRSIFALGNKKIVKNNVAILEIDNKGILKKKEIFDLSNMNKYKFSENTTQNTYTKDTYIYGVLTSFREKINAPAKRKKVSE